MKKVFLSFAGQDTVRAMKIIPLLASQEYELNFYSGAQLEDCLDQPQAADIKRLIGEKIVASNVTVCLISEHSHSSPRVELELQKSLNKGNRIIAMALKGTQEAVLPRIIREENLKFYPWDPQQLRRLLEDDRAKLFNNSR